MDGADPNTFIVDGPSKAHDKNHRYYSDKIVED